MFSLEPGSPRKERMEQDSFLCWYDMKWKARGFPGWGLTGIEVRCLPCPEPMLLRGGGPQSTQQTTATTCPCLLTTTRRFHPARAAEVGWMV